MAVSRLSLCLAAAALLLGACATTSGPAPVERPFPDPVVDQPDVVIDPELGEETGGRPGGFDPVLDDGSRPNPPQEEVITPPIATPQWEPNVVYDSPAFRGLDSRPALAAFKRSCEIFAKRDGSNALHKRHARYGVYADWAPACAAASSVASDPISAQGFFREHFVPVRLSNSGETGMLTGYYEPEIEVRRQPGGEFTEAILAMPYKESDRKRPRSEIGPAVAPVIGFGRPIEVFFMQVQGSGRIKYDDGTSLRAAFAAHNSQPYKSIGRVLIERGELTRHQASKQSISAWMERAGYAKAKALMNENPRYIFFKAETINPGEGPKGAQTVPLSGMGSLAIDPKYHPYGAIVFLETTLPQYGGDYTGAPAGALVVAQDTGGAIKGPLRGDLFFGSGDEAGDRAGVMKHQARWTILLPKAAAARLRPGS